MSKKFVFTSVLGSLVIISLLLSACGKPAATEAPAAPEAPAEAPAEAPQE